MKKIIIKNKIAQYKEKNWHPELVEAYEKLLKGDESQKKILEDHYKGKEIDWGNSLFNFYLKKAKN